MWSLTSPRVGRTSGAKKFRSSAKKDFFNGICQKLPSKIALSVLFQESRAEHDGVEQSKTSGNQNLNLR
jgi:hypothetical protein